jgi:acetyl esterase/lipase
MKFRFVILFFLFTFCVFARHSYAQEKPKPMPIQQTPQRSLRDLVMKPVVYRVAGMDKVRVVSNLKYTDIDNPNLLMDVYSPPNPAKGEKLPAVIFIHGAAGAEYKPKDWGFYISWG